MSHPDLFGLAVVALLALIALILWSFASIVGAGLDQIIELLKGRK